MISATRAQRHRFGTIEDRLQGLPVDEFHDDESLAIVFAVVMDLHHAGMRQAAGDLGLLPEPHQQFVDLQVVLVAGLHHLDGNAPGQRRVPGFPHRAGRTAPDRLPKLVAAQPLVHVPSLSDRAYYYRRPATKREDTGRHYIARA
jgi:hypothetical protein